MNWVTDIVWPKIKKTTPKEISDDLWVKCPECGQMLFSKELKQSMYVCTKCGHHLRLYVDKRLKQLFDDGIYTEMALPTVKEDPLKFKDTQKYVDRLKVYRKKTGNNDAIKVGTGKVGGIDAVVAAMDFSFMGGSMGTAVGEGIVAAAEYAYDHDCPLIIASASGGAASVITNPLICFVKVSVRTALFPTVSVAVMAIVCAPLERAVKS